MMLTSPVLYLALYPGSSGSPLHTDSGLVVWCALANETVANLIHVQRLTKLLSASASSFVPLPSTGGKAWAGCWRTMCTTRVGLPRPRKRADLPGWPVTGCRHVTECPASPRSTAQPTPRLLSSHIGCFSSKPLSFEGVSKGSLLLLLKESNASAQGGGQYKALLSLSEVTSTAAWGQNKTKLHRRAFEVASWD